MTVEDIGPRSSHEATALRDARVIENVQALRALAAMAVVLTHAAAIWPALGLENRGLFSYGRYGVDLFFVISGYIMALIASRRQASPAGFLVNRIVRIVPLYWLLTCAVFALSIATPSLLGSTSPSLLDLVRSLFFIPFSKDGGAFLQPVLFVGWTLNYEMFFYAIFAVCLALKDRAFAATLAILLVLVVVGAFLPDPGPLTQFYTAPLLLEFAAGMLIFRFQPKLEPRFGPAILLAGIVLLALSVGAEFKADRAIAAGIPAALIVLGSILCERGGIRFAALRLLGDASYSIYLIHPFVTKGVEKVYLRLTPESYQASLSAIEFVAAFLAAVGFGLAVYLLVERPLVRAARRLAHRDGTGATWHSKSAS
jgi:peptidoglycan/LPS O-acetylase OafA/YrhL